MSGESSSSAGVIPNDQLQADIFKLKMDHFEELFDWLSLKDLVMLSKTCKRMQHVVGYYTKTIYSAIYPRYRSNSIYKGDEFADASIKLDRLSSVLNKLVFYYLGHIRKDRWGRKWGNCIPHMKTDQFKSLTEVLLTRVVLTHDGISRIKPILAQVETVKLKFPYFFDGNNEFYVSFLQFCTNMKKLCIQGGPVIGIDSNWLRRKYPKLEHFELTTGSENGDLQTFFEQNENIKSFSTSVEDILANRNIFTNTELKLDVLSVKFSRTETFDSARDLLNELHKRGLFKQLHVYWFTLYNSILDQNSVSELIKFNGFTKLFIEGMEDGTDLSPLNCLKHLCVNRAKRITNMYKLVKELKNLELVQFTFATIDDILPFVRDSPKVNTIVVYRLDENNGNIFNIRKLNEARSKLTKARKVTIYVEEHVYLAMKWAKNETNCSLVEIKRGTSYDALNHCFVYVDYPDMTF